MKYKTLISLLGFFLTIEASMGCSCSPVKLDSAYKYATVVFHGKVTEIIKNHLHNDLGSSPIITNLRILKPFKMINKAEGELISIIYGHETCEYYLEENKEYIVFAYDMGSGYYSTSVCSPTTLADNFSESDYQRLIKLSDSIPITSYYGPMASILLDSASYKAMIMENEDLKFVIQEQNRKIKLLIYSMVILIILSVVYVIILKRKLSS